MHWADGLTISPYSMYKVLKANNLNMGEENWYKHLICLDQHNILIIAAECCFNAVHMRLAPHKKGHWNAKIKR